MGDHRGGQHPFQIQPGTEGEKKDRVTIFPSLHYQGNLVRHPEKLHFVADNHPSGALAGFGIRHLDNMLHKAAALERFGLPAGKPFAIIGEAGTFKSSVGNAFLAQAVADVASTQLPAAKWPGAEDSKGIIILCSSRIRNSEELAASLSYQLIASNASIPYEGRDDSHGELTNAIKDLCSVGPPRIIIDSLAIHDHSCPN